ncbi:MAG: hypothetical protein M1355_00055 [Patescibacteria group bacterium]|nr:hypothetical protein [Patescibacteria group bacterium]
MKEILNKIKNWFFRQKENIVYFFFFLIFALIAYSYYLVLNPNQDMAFEQKVTKENQAVDIKFDKKALEKIENLAKKPVKKDAQGQDPFMTY